HDRTFLQRQHIARGCLNGERVHQRQLGGAGIAENHLHPFLTQQFEKGALAGDQGHAGTTGQSGSIHSPPALLTAAGRVGATALSTGAWTIGTSMPSRSQSIVFIQGSDRHSSEPKASRCAGRNVNHFNSAFGTSATSSDEVRRSA